MKFIYKSEKVITASLSVATVAVIFVFLLNEIYSFDIWWHIVIGRDILEKISIPNIDIYTAAGFGNPYHDSHWLFQVLCAVAHKIFGMIGIQLLVLIIWGGTLILTCVSCRRNVRLELSLLLVFLVAMASTERFVPRPELITFFMIALFYWILHEGRYSVVTRSLVLLAGQVIWVNSHGLFVIGPFMVASYLISASFDLYKGNRNSVVRQYSIFFGMVCLGSLITPHGLDAWRYAFLLFREAGPNAPQVLQELGELSPTFGQASRNGIAFWFYGILLLCTITGLVNIIVKRDVHPGRLLILIGLFAASLSGRRNMALFALVSAPMIAEVMPPLFRDRPIPKIVTVAYMFFLLVWMMFPLSGRYQQLMQFPARFGFGTTPSFFPYGFLEFIRENNITGQVYNSNYLGGFYLYHSYPFSLPLTDGRWEIYNTRDLKQIRLSASSPVLFHKLVEKYQLKGLLLQHVSPEAQSILPWIKDNVNWQLVYLDYAVSFWLPRDYPPVKTKILQLDSSALDESGVRVEDVVLLATFYKQTAMFREYALVLEKLIRKKWKVNETLLELGRILIKTGQYGKAEKVFSKLLANKPKSMDSLNELAFLAYHRGDIGQAEIFLLRALKVDGTNKQAQNNLKIIRQSKRKNNYNLLPGKRKI